MEGPFFTYFSTRACLGFKRMADHGFPRGRRLQYIYRKKIMVKSTAYFMKVVKYAKTSS